MTINGLTGSVPSVGVPTTLLEEYTDYGGGGDDGPSGNPPLVAPPTPYEINLSGPFFGTGRFGSPQSNVAVSIQDDDDVPFFGGGGGGTPLRPGISSLFLDADEGHGTEPLVPPGGGHFDPPPWGVPGKNPVPHGPVQGPGGGHFDPGPQFAPDDEEDEKQQKLWAEYKDIIRRYLVRWWQRYWAWFYVAVAELFFRPLGGAASPITSGSGFSAHLYKLAAWSAMLDEVTEALAQLGFKLKGPNNRMTDKKMASILDEYQQCLIWPDDLADKLIAASMLAPRKVRTAVIIQMVKAVKEVRRTFGEPPR